MKIHSMVIFLCEDYSRRGVDSLSQTEEGNSGCEKGVKIKLSYAFRLNKNYEGNMKKI